MLLAGSISVVILELAELSIHGDRYLDALVQTPEQAARNEASRVRIPTHAVAPGLTLGLGSRVTLTLLMGQVTRVEPA
jgi:hypothetical protein